MIEEKYEEIRKAITNGEDEDAKRIVNEALEGGLPPLEILNRGLVNGILKTGELWKNNVYFLADVILSADAFKAAMEPLDPKLREAGEGRHVSKFVIGAVEGDMHDLGKNIVIAMLTSAGFEVIDLGVNVPRDRFIEAVKQHQPAIVGIGAYMTTTMLEMKAIIAELESQGLRQKVKVMVGGVPTSQEFSNEAGADAWGKDALDAMYKARALADVSQ